MTEIEIAALYRSIRQVDNNGCVKSEWETRGSGPARSCRPLTAEAVAAGECDAGTAGKAPAADRGAGPR